MLNIGSGAARASFVEAAACPVISGRNRAACLFAALILAAALPGLSLAQQPNVGDLQREIQALQQRLRTLEGGQEEPPTRSATLHSQRTTDLGARWNTREPQMIVRIYDLNDLFALAPAYEAQRSVELGGAGGAVFSRSSEQGNDLGGMGGGGGFFSVRETSNYQVGAKNSNSTSAARTSLSTLVQVIAKTISPHEWDDAGGPGKIEALGMSLVISAEARTHEQIELLLTQLRKRWKTLRTVSVRAWWLWLTDEQLAKLVPTADEPPRDGTPFGLVDDEAWREHFAELRDGQAEPGYRAAVTCYNGQTVHTQSSGESLAVTEMEPNVLDFGDKQQVVGYRPVARVLREGATLQVTPIATSSGKFAVVDLHSRVARLSRSKRFDRPAAPPAAEGRIAPADIAAAIERPFVTTQRLSTTLRAPIDQTLLAGGMTFDSEPAAHAPGLYLFVRVGIQELRDDLNPEPAIPAQPADQPDAVKEE